MSSIATKSKSVARIEFFELLFGSDVTEGGYLCVATTDPIAPKTSFHQRFFNWPQESVRMENYIIKNEVNKNLYFCINLLSEMERKKKYCKNTNLLWADLDEVNPATIGSIPPPIIIQSSPARWQAFWRLTTRLSSYDAEQYSKRVAYAFGADASGWDLTQLFRIPFTKNFKYPTSPPVILERAMKTQAEVILFEVLPKLTDQEQDIHLEIPVSDMSVEEIIGKYVGRFDTGMFLTLYSNEPEEGQDWSRLLWHLLHLCFKAGMTEEEVFTIAQGAACNKYARDGRPLEHLWKDVLKASKDYGKLPSEKEMLVMPQLVDDKPYGDTFVDQYLAWALESTDAVPEFHELSAFIVLSAIISASVRLSMKSGEFVPNLWGMILGDSTVTRKSTAMRMAMELVATLDDQIHMASDASPEGLITGLSNRPNQVSMFFRDELSGLFQSIANKDYMASMLEILTNIYDVPRLYSRILKKETIRVERPIFIFFGGGITDRVQSAITEDWILSGFIPRFLIVSGEGDMEKWRPSGPAVSIHSSKRNKLLEFLANIYENYAQEISGKLGGQPFAHPPRIEAFLTDEAWEAYGKIEYKLADAGFNSIVKDLALPTFERLSKSMLKMAMLIAACRQEPIDDVIMVEKDDITQAAWYVQKWGQYSVRLVLSAGKSVPEKKYEQAVIKIRDHPGIFRGTLMQHLHWSKKDADEILSTLEERGQIRKEKSNHGWKFWAL